MEGIDSLEQLAPPDGVQLRLHGRARSAELRCVPDFVRPAHNLQHSIRNARRVFRVIDDLEQLGRPSNVWQDSIEVCSVSFRRSLSTTVEKPSTPSRRELRGMRGMRASSHRGRVSQRIRSITHA